MIHTSLQFSPLDQASFAKIRYIVWSKKAPQWGNLQYISGVALFVACMIFNKVLAVHGQVTVLKVQSGWVTLAFARYSRIICLEVCVPCVPLQILMCLFLRKSSALNACEMVQFFRQWCGFVHLIVLLCQGFLHEPCCLIVDVWWDGKFLVLAYVLTVYLWMV